MLRAKIVFLSVAALIFVLGGFAEEAFADQVYWPGWLGPDRSGWVDYFQPPTDWPKALKKVWQVDVGTGYATPLVANGRVFQYARQGEDEVLWCFDLKTGKQKWRKSQPDPFTMGQGGEWHGKGPKSAPILDDGRLFTMSISGVLTAWNAETGEVLWQRDHKERFAKPKATPYWGATTSPIVDRDRVMVHFGNDERGVLVALNVETGDEIWSQPKDAPSYSSPLLTTLHGVRQLIEWNHRAVVGVNVENGEILWEYPFEHEGSNQNMPTPSVHEGRIFVGGENRGFRCVEPRLQNNVWSAKEIWRQDRVALDMSSAVVNNGLLYGFSHYDKGRLFCADAKSGDVLWQGPPRTGANVTFLSMAGHVVALLDKGELQILSAQGKDSSQIASYKVSETPTWAAPVWLNDGVLIKDHDKLMLWSME